MLWNDRIKLKECFETILSLGVIKTNTIWLKIIPEVQSKSNGIDYLGKLRMVHFSIILAGGSSDKLNPSPS